MSSVFPHGIKDLKISAPTSVGQKASALRCKVILISKFDFAGESADELTVKKGDVLKLLDRLSNGWVLVEFIDKIAAPGLVPALYVDIAVNDPVNPVTLSWLHAAGSGPTSPSFYDVQVQMLLEKNSPFSINNRLYPLAVSVSNYLMYENRFWYRVDVTYSSGEQGYLCRYYSDFYDLHSALLDYVNGLDGEDTKPALPKLPEPVPSQRRNSAEQRALFSGRCADLSTYMHGLVACKRVQVCPALIDWLDVTFKTLPGLIVPETPLEGNDEVNQQILPGSVVVATKATAFTVPEQLTKDPESPVEGVKFKSPAHEGPKLPKPKNTYNHYQQAANAKVNIARSLSTSDNGNGRYPSRSTSKLERSKTVNTGAMASRQDSLKVAASPPALGRAHTVKTASPQIGQIGQGGQLGSGRSGADQISVPPTRKPSEHAPPPKVAAPDAPGMKTPSSIQNTPVSAMKPTFSPKPAAPGAGSKRIRCEIKTQSNDNVVVRVALGESPDLEQFKSAVYSKFAYNNLYIREGESGAYEEIDSPDLDVMALVLGASTVYLLVT